MNNEQFLRNAIDTARANLANGSSRSPRQAAIEALQEAHSSTSQRAFFAMVDALGGHEAAISQIIIGMDRENQ